MAGLGENLEPVAKEEVQNTESKQINADAVRMENESVELSDEELKDVAGGLQDPDPSN